MRAEFAQEKIWIRGCDDEVAEPACAPSQADDLFWIERVMVVLIPPLPFFVRVLDIGEGYFPNGTAEEENAHKTGINGVLHV